MKTFVKDLLWNREYFGMQVDDVLYRGIENQPSPPYSLFVPSLAPFERYEEPLAQEIKRWPTNLAAPGSSSA